MRTFRAALIIGIAWLLLAVVGCAKQVTGTALPDPTKVPLALAADGYGIVAGFDDAPARIEIYTEPQCSHCSDLQRDFGDQLRYFVNVGRLQITYRPLTFLDDDYDGYSSKVANALFLAAVPAATLPRRAHSSSASFRTSGSIRIPAGRRSPETNCAPSRSAPGCPTPLPTTSQATTRLSTSPRWRTPTSPSCSTSTR